MPVVRVSILRCNAANFATCRDLMNDARGTLEDPIRAMTGLRAYDAGADEATLSLTNVSVWETLQDAKQMDTLQPMLDLAARFVALGVTFERPIMNYQTLWELP